MFKRIGERESLLNFSYREEKEKEYEKMKEETENIMKSLIKEREEIEVVRKELDKSMKDLETEKEKLRDDIQKKKTTLDQT